MHTLVNSHFLFQNFLVSSCTNSHYSSLGNKSGAAVANLILGLVNLILAPVNQVF